MVVVVGVVGVGVGVGGIVMKSVSPMAGEGREATL